MSDFLVARDARNEAHDRLVAGLYVTDTPVQDPTAGVPPRDLFVITPELRMQAANAAGPFDDYRALVVLYLYGGTDSHNMIIPLGSDYATYANWRSNLAIPQANVIPISAGVSGRSFGMHPNMKALAAIFNNERKLAVASNVGVLLEPTTLASFQQKRNLPPQLFSHADMVSHTQTGRADWIGRRGRRHKSHQFVLDRSGER